ncbi:MAG: hypothetical protein P1U38_03945 [Aeromicrobium sp.]|uniref:hypothetical protein n=1 Tax=Aeromicrobium sp. TaxID=1871063 RepID=UPI00261B83FA|nr:hypothetical protein [Aeromicrobium sp.]MDF1703901.1 hypothetical protein [Aeromicrobium sp.]
MRRSVTPTGSRTRRPTAVGLASAMLLSVLAAVLPARPAEALLGSTSSCGWALQFSPDQLNLFYPDEGATYWAAVLPIPPGGRIEVEGDYPYARYMSFTTYTPATQAIDGINDQLIGPDRGSTNPFMVGARRDLPDRDYTVRVVNERVPTAGRAPNTLYTENADGSKSTKLFGSVGLVMRVYAPDEGRDLAGGVPLPQLSIVSSTGRKVTLPTCPNLVPSTTLSTAVAGLDSVNLPLTGLLAQNPPRWRKFTNLASAEVGFLLDNAVTGTTLLPLVHRLTDQILPPGGFFENPDNTYIAANMDQSFGDVLVLRAKAPTTPHTTAGQSTMGAGQLRYWSMCVENAQTTQVYGCAFDEQVPVDADGYYTIVVSSPSKRPANATPSCGVAWLPAGPLQQSLLLLRHMLPDPGFDAAIQHLDADQEQERMGEYYPDGTYQSTSDFEAGGCSTPRP